MKSHAQCGPKEIRFETKAELGHRTIGFGYGESPLTMNAAQNAFHMSLDHLP